MTVTTSTDNKIELIFNESTLHFSMAINEKKWRWAGDFVPRIEYEQGTLLFCDARSITHTSWKTGVGEGFHSCYKDFSFNGDNISLSFETVAWVEYSTGNLYFEFIPIEESALTLREIYWPGTMEFDEKQEKWYSVLNVLQGLIIPNTWENEVNKLVFDGQLCSTAAYMPWWGQIRPDSGYIAICVHPWDAKYFIDHPASGPYSHVGIKWLPSLGKMSYRRVMRYSFIENCDYNDLCKVYRLYSKEQGLFTSLAEKAAKNPLVDKLIGSAIVHTGIKQHCSPDSFYYNKENIELNDSLTPFSVRTEQIKKLHAAGLEKVYLHLDGWGEPGYDNQHPDYLPPCVQAGGFEAMKQLSDTMKEFNYMFGIHDQYRDYYYDAKTFDENFAIRNTDGSIPTMARWAGGKQTFLCTTQAPYYVKRNFETLFANGIELEATYLDVFTCNEGDECSNPLHKMTRKECFELRKACFDYLNSRNILPSSEEVVDWAMQSLVFAHYAPYDYMLAAKDAPRKGIPTPLFNLVYHDCIISPWFMNHEKGEDDYMLYALLNGGSAYLNMELEGEQLALEIQRYKIVSALQQKIAKCEMVSHKFLDDKYRIQQTVFSNGMTVTIDFNTQTYTLVDITTAKR